MTNDEEFEEAVHATYCRLGSVERTAHLWGMTSDCAQMIIDKRNQARALEPKQMSADQAREIIRGLAASAGSIANLARRLGVTTECVRLVLAGKRNPGAKFFEKLSVDIRAVTVYVMTPGDGER